MSTISPNQCVMTALDNLQSLRPFPTVATRLLQLGDAADLRELAGIIECDPAVSLQLLRVANSSLYGFAGQIRSLSHAIVILGYREARNLALSLASGQLFGQGGRESGMCLWHHSLGCAVVARSLCEFVPAASPDEAFLGGILHDVGKLVFLDVIPDEYTRATRNLDPFVIEEVESSQFGITHQQVGEQCAEEWGLPRDLRDVIATHHHFTPLDDSETSLVGVVRIANCLAQEWAVGTQDGLDMPTESACLASTIDLTAEQLEQLRESALDAYAELASTCAA